MPRVLELPAAPRRCDRVTAKLLSARAYEGRGFGAVEIPQRGSTPLVDHSAQLHHLVRSRQRTARQEKHALAFEKLRLERHFGAREERARLLMLASDLGRHGGKGKRGRHRVAEGSL